MKRLTKDGEDLREEFDTMEDIGCHCHLNPPCSYCIHPGNPSNLEEDPDMWEEE